MRVKKNSPGTAIDEGGETITKYALMTRDETLGEIIQ